MVKFNHEDEYETIDLSVSSGRSVSSKRGKYASAPVTKGNLTDICEEFTQHFEAVIKNLTEESDELKRTHSIFVHYTQQGWMYSNNSFYYKSVIAKSWQESRDDCLQRGADLVIINSKEELDLTRKFKSRVWIGLTDNETEGIWKWVDGTPVNTSYWVPDEPNNFKGTDEDCGEIKFFGEENSWNDSPCEMENLWICEKNVAQQGNM